MDLFINLYKSSLFFNYQLLPEYRYYDLYIRSLNMSYRFQQENYKYILFFLPNCIEYIECIYASVLSNINTIHCSYDNILKYILLPNIDLIITTKEYLHIINKLLDKCNITIRNEISAKILIVHGYTNGRLIHTKKIATNEQIVHIYKKFLQSSTKSFIFPYTNININNNTSTNKSTNTSTNINGKQFLKVSVQYIQYQSYYIKNKYSNKQYTLFPYDLYTLKGIIYIFNIINNWEYILDINCPYRYDEDIIQHQHFPLDIRRIDRNDSSSISYILKLHPDDMNRYNMFYDSIDNSIKLIQNKDIYSTNSITDSISISTDIIPISTKDTNGINSTDIYCEYIDSIGFLYDDYIKYDETVLIIYQNIELLNKNEGLYRINIENCSFYTKYIKHTKIKTKKACLSENEYSTITIDPFNHPNVGIINTSRPCNIYKFVLPFKITLDKFYELGIKGTNPYINKNHYISKSGITLCDFIEKQSNCSEHIFNIWLLYDRSTILYTFSRFSQFNPIEVHNFILNELYKDNNIEIQQNENNLCNEMNWEIYKTEKEVEHRYKTIKGLLPIRISELFYIVYYLIYYVLERYIEYRKKENNQYLMQKLLLLEKYVELNAHIEYNFILRKHILNREQYYKLVKFCNKNNVDIDMYINVLMSSILYKINNNLCVYCKVQTNYILETDYIHIKPMMHIMTNFPIIYTQLFSRMRFWVHKYLNDNYLLKRNGIYISSRCQQGGYFTEEEGFYSKENNTQGGCSMNNLSGICNLYVDKELNLVCDIFGMKFKDKNHVMILSPAIEKFKEYIRTNI